MRLFSALLLVACTEVSINKLPNDPEDSSIIVVDTYSPNPSAEPSVEPMDGIGGYHHYYLRQVACPVCVGEPKEIEVTFTAQYHEKTTQSHTDWIVEQGQCVTNLVFTEPAVVPIDYKPSIEIIGSQHMFSAYLVDYHTYSVEITEPQYDRDAVHEILLTGEISYGFTSYHGFDSIEPFELLYVEPSYAFAAPIRKSGATFWWSPSGSDGTFMITVVVYSSDGSQMLGYVSCASADSGMMTIPGQYLQYPTWSLVAVHLARHRVELVPLDAANTYIESHMEWEVIGTGHIE